MGNCSGCGIHDAWTTWPHAREGNQAVTTNPSIPRKIQSLRLHTWRRCQHIEIYDVETVLAVAEAGSFRKAGMLLGIGQSAVTRRIRKLEDVLGVSMFERSAAGARLTVAGWDFATRSRQLANQFLDTVRAAQSAGTAGNGQLRVGLTASLSQGALREVVARFQRLHADVELSFTEADLGELMTSLSHRSIDVVGAAGEPTSEHADMMLLTRAPLYIAVAGDHPLVRRRCVDWSDVAAMSFLVSADVPGPTIHDYIIRRISDFGHLAGIEVQGMRREGLMNLVGLGLGISLVCEQWCGVRYPNVVFIPLKERGKAETIPFSLTWRPENDNPALRRFLSLAREVAKADAASSGPS
jgi:DNA-binding transcriptional LysR family regulator